jgi:hypothetical protein
VTFNQAVDPEKANFAVKRGAASVNVADITFKEDNKTAVVELPTKFVKADYTVTISGLTEEAIVKELSTEAETVATIEVLGDTAAATYNGDNEIDGATIAYQVLNQYGENVTDESLASSITWTPSAGEADDNNRGQLIFEGSYRLDQNVTVTGVDQASGTVVTKAIKIGSASVVDTVNLNSLYNVDGKELNTESDFTEFDILLDAKDQYGNKITSTGKLFEDLIVTSSNPSVVSFEANPFVDNAGEDGDQLGIQLKKPANNMHGKATVRVISKSTGKTVTFEVEVAEAAKVDSFTINQPTKVVGAGETVEIPFEAFDQYGDAITKYNALNGVVSLSATGGHVAFKNDYVNRKAVLEFRAPATEGNYVITAVTPTGKLSQITVKVEDSREAAVVAKASSMATTLVEGGTTTLRARDITVQDQHGRDYKLADFFADGYSLNVEVKDDSVDVVELSGTTTFTASNQTATITANGKGTKRFVVSIIDANGDLVESSELEFPVRVVEKSAVSEFAIGDVKEIQAVNGAEVSFDVHGLLSGSKVGLPSDMFAVTATHGLRYADGKLILDDASGLDFDTSDKIEATVTVQVDSAEGLVTLTKKVTIVDEASKLATIDVDSTDYIEVANGVATAPLNYASIANLKNVFEGEDQFGNDYALVNPTFFVSNIKDENGVAKTTSAFVTNNGRTNAAITGALQPGYTFTLAVTTEGITKTIQVVVDRAASHVDAQLSAAEWTTNPVLGQLAEASTATLDFSDVDQAGQLAEASTATLDFSDVDQAGDTVTIGDTVLVNGVDFTTAATLALEINDADLGVTAVDNEDGTITLSAAFESGIEVVLNDGDASEATIAIDNGGQPAIIAENGTLVITFSNAVNFSDFDLEVDGGATVSIALDDVEVDGNTVTISEIAADSDLGSATDITNVLNLTDLATGEEVTVVDGNVTITTAE